MKKDKRFVESGKKGAKKRWGSRPEMLEELRRYADSQLYPHLIKWPTEHLKILLQVYKK